MDSALYLSHMRKSAVTLEDLSVETLVRIAPSPSQSDALQDVSRHDHKYSELFACISGEVWLDTADGLLRLEAGDLAVVPPGVPHVHIRRLLEKDWCALAFTGARRTAPGTRSMYRRCAALFEGDTLVLLRGQPELCRRALDIAEGMQNAPEYLPALRLTDLLLCIGERTPDAMPALPDRAQESELTRSAYLEYLINNYYMRPVTAQQIAAMLYVSPRQLTRILQKKYGATLHELMMDKRVTAAGQFLRGTALTVDEIARTVGFSSRAGLYREFCKRRGVTPAQYRQQTEEASAGQEKRF